MFKLEDRVFIISEKCVGIVKEFKNETKEYKVTFFRKSNPNKRIVKYFKEKQLRPYQKPEQILVKYFADIEKIEKISKGDWVDLRAAETVELKAGDYRLIPLGVGMKLPEGYEANIVERSSTFKHWGILQTNSYGVIDNTYSGNNDQWHFPAYATRDVVIEKNSRICQFRINKIQPRLQIVEVDNLDEVSRGGIGSTGK